MINQQGRILAHLKQGNGLTSLAALERFDCFRLAAQIHSLKRKGHQIKTTMIRVPSGKKVARYNLEVEF